MAWRTNIAGYLYRNDTPDGPPFSPRFYGLLNSFTYTNGTNGTWWSRYDSGGSGGVTLRTNGSGVMTLTVPGGATVTGPTVSLGVTYDICVTRVSGTSSGNYELIVDGVSYGTAAGTSTSTGSNSYHGHGSDSYNGTDRCDITISYDREFPSVLSGGENDTEACSATAVKSGVLWDAQLTTVSTNLGGWLSGNPGNETTASQPTLRCGGGPTTYFITPSGSITPAATLTRQTQKPLGGSTTPAGALARQTGKVLAGSVTPAGALRRQTNKPLSGSVTPTGALSRLTAKFFAGTVTPSGILSVIKAVLRSFGGTITPTGTLSRQARITRGGTTTPTGALRRDVSAHYGGVTSPTGVVLKLTTKRFLGSVTPSGTLASIIVTILGYLRVLFRSESKYEITFTSESRYDVGFESESRYDVEVGIS